MALLDQSLTLSSLKVKFDDFIWVKWHHCRYLCTNDPDNMCRAALGLFKKHQLWKLKEGQVVSHGFRHAEFNCAGKNRFQAFLGVSNLISMFWKCMGCQKIKIKNTLNRCLKSAKR